jgi:RNA polymerase sigma-70 factor (ECF subfamily)
VSTNTLIEDFYRHQYGQVVAILTCKFGLERLESVEDAVQSALMTAFEAWSRAAPPDNAPAWIYRVAHNYLIDSIRRERREDKHATPAAEATPALMANAPAVALPHEVPDSLLRMMFVCCDDAIPLESQLAFALKVLCGFDIREIAHRLFTSEANVYKRISRARERLRQQGSQLDDIPVTALVVRLPAVRKVLYVLFTEGYLSTRDDEAIRRELCVEAIRLTTLLAKHPIVQTPETCALLALMHLHLGRMPARLDLAGGLLLLEEQDRQLWDQNQIAIGLEWLAKSAQGELFSQFHAEAGIAAEHCLAPSFDATRWDRIAELYQMLEHIAPSLLHRLNRAVAVAEWQGAEAGLIVLSGFEPPAWLASSYLWCAVQADLHRRAGNVPLFEHYRATALDAAPSAATKTLLARRLRINE